MALGSMGDFMAVKVFLMVYQNVEMLGLNLECLTSMSGISKEDIVVIDMGIDGRAGTWLKEQEEYDYLCADKLENYAGILNAAVREFTHDEDILLLNANTICLGDCIRQLEKTCSLEEKTGAAMSVNFASVCSREMDIPDAWDWVKGMEEEAGTRLSLKISGECVLLARRFLADLGEFDGQLLLPDTVMLDYSFRGLNKKWKLVTVKDAVSYELIPHRDFYAAILGKDAGRDVLKAKWGMNYFNTIPNKSLVDVIDRKEDEVFSLLEVGCDCGANMSEIKNRFPGASLYGLEINPDAAKIAACFGEVLTGNIEENGLPYEGQVFDYILFGDVLEHLRDPEQVIAYCRQFLRPGGKVIASIPNLMHYTVLKELLQGDFTYQDTGLLDRTHIHFFTYNEIIRMFARTGYEITSCTYLMYGDMQEKDRQFVAELKQLGGGETFFFLAYQYLVVADGKVSRGIS